MKRELRLNQLKTPENVVNIMLDLAGYYGEKILDKKEIDANKFVDFLKEQFQ